MEQKIRKQEVKKGGRGEGVSVECLVLSVECLMADSSLRSLQLLTGLCVKFFG